MFPRRLFPGRLFAPRLFPGPGTGEAPALPVGTQWAARTEAVGWAWTRSEGM